MRFVYKNYYARIPRVKMYQSWQTQMLDDDGNEYTFGFGGDPGDGLIDVCVGGMFEADDGKTPISYTDYSVLSCDRGYNTRRMLNDIGAFFGERTRDVNPCEYVIWDDDFEKKVRLYYLVMDGGIVRMFITRIEDMTMGDTTGIAYYGNIDGRMMNLLPEDGDVIFDNTGEAERYKKQQDKKK